MSSRWQEENNRLLFSVTDIDDQGPKEPASVPYCVQLLPSVSKCVLHKLTFVLRVSSVEKPNISINFSQSVHSHSGLTVPEVLLNNQIVDFCIHENVVKNWGLLTHLGRIKKILLWIGNNSELTAHQSTFLLTCRALIGR